MRKTNKTTSKNTKSKKPTSKRVAKGAKTKAQKRTRLKKIGIFGGTFDPIHYGHLNSIETLQSALKFDEFFVIPANQNPLRVNSRTAIGDQRLEMAQLALSDQERFSNVHVLTDEIERGGLSYTAETLRRLTSRLPGCEFYLCMGADQLNVFDRWRDYRKILSLSNLIITTRPGHEIATSKSGLPAWLQDELKSFRYPIGKLKTNKTIRFVSLNDIDVSASEIRRKVRHGESVEHLTPVANYLVEHKVYAPEDRKIDDYREFAKFCAKIAIDRGALNVQAYDLRQIAQPSEFTVVATGTSARHTRGLCESIAKEARDNFDIFPLSTEGLQESRWVIVDYGHLIIHVFFDYVRNEYRIEDLWAGASRIELK